MRFTQEKVGAIVRVIGIPNLSGMAESCRRESAPVFRYLVGKKKKIVAIDENGAAKLLFVIRKGHHKGSHTVWLEPEFLEEIT